MTNFPENINTKTNRALERIPQREKERNVWNQREISRKRGDA